MDFVIGFARLPCHALVLYPKASHLPVTGGAPELTDHSLRVKLQKGRVLRYPTRRPHTPREVHVSVHHSTAWRWILALIAVAAGRSVAQTPPCDDQNAQTVPVVYPPGTGDPCAAEWTIGGQHATPQWQQPSFQGEYGFFASACWRGTRESLSLACMLQSGDPPATPAPWGNPWDSWGFYLNMDPIGQPSIGDFLPPSPTLGGTSACLVPDAAANAPTGWQGLSRPTVDRVVDLVTGLPLVQVEDLSLPVDGATFRLVRTRSQDSNLSTLSCVQPDRWWDWTGEGWMISENPFLLIDSAVPETVGNQPRTTYLLLDAHHSIPFQLIEATGLRGTRSLPGAAYA